MEELIGGSEERVLIETYWNVNKILLSRPAAELVVLIETYWNVNKQFVEMSENRVGINRNILECKYDDDHIKRGSKVAY